MKQSLPGSLDRVLQLFVLGFDGYSLPDDVAAMLASGLAGVAIFRRNIRDSGQLRDLCLAIRRAAEPSGMMPLIAVDQEGGRVQRLRDICTAVPAMSVVEDPEAAGLEIGRQLSSIGFNVDFAPVLDVDSNPANPIIGDRAFSSRPDEAAVRSVSFFRGLRAAGVAGCGKHFPGHGDASADSHLELPVINADIGTLESRELVPFEAAVRAGFGMMMTAHCLYPEIDPVLPATLSKKFIGPILRERLGFDGVVITDDLGMKAVCDRFNSSQTVLLGLEAGVDLFLHCGIAGEGRMLVAALSEALSGNLVSRARVNASIWRVAAFRAMLA